MLAWMTLLACALYLAPLVALVVLLRRAEHGVIALAFTIPVAVATDLLVMFALCWLFRVEQVAFIRTAALAALALGIVVARAARRRPIVPPRGALSWGDLIALGAAMLLGFYLSYDLSSRFWIWDREWHTPFTAALRVQQMPFRNVYEPGLTLRYHMAGDVFAALLQSLSFARMNASRALSFAHDMQSALLVGSIAMIFRARTPWSPLVAALAAAVPFLLGPMGYYYGAMGAYQGFADFSNFTLSFRPHCILALLMLVGFTAFVSGFVERTNQAPSPRPRSSLLGLVPLFGLAAITDEMSTALIGVTFAALWLWRPNLLAPRRWQGAALLAVLAASALAANLLLSGTIGPGGPVSHAHWVAPRIPHFIGKPVALDFSKLGWQELLLDEAPLLFPAGVAFGLVLRRREGREPASVALWFAGALMLLGLVLFLSFEMNDRIYEGHRFMTAARMTVPIVALCFAPQLARASLPSLLLIVPLAAGVASTWGHSYSRVPGGWNDARGAAAYAADCRVEYGARLGEPIVPTYVDEPFWFPYAGCRPIFAAGHDGAPGVVLAGWPKLGAAGFAKMDQGFFPPATPAAVVCPRDARKTAVCQKAERLGDCSPDGSQALRCTIPPANRAAMGRP
jgi:hypothetical protein